MLKGKILKTGVALACAAFIAVTGIKANAANYFTDLNGHWGAVEIYKAVDRGFMSGYSDGTFRPDVYVTRAEFSKMMNDALKLKDMAAVTFVDTPSNSWYYEEIRKAVSAGYIFGYADHTFGAGRKITRQEAATIIYRVITNAYGRFSGQDVYKDYDEIPTWAREAVRATYLKGYMVGDAEGKFNPEAFLTRAEVAKIINSVVENENIVTSTLEVTKSGAKYSNTIFVNGVKLSNDIKNGSVTFENCRLLGETKLNNGDSTKLVMTDASANSVESEGIGKSFSTQLEGNSYITNLSLDNAITVNEVGLTNEGLKNVEIDASPRDTTRAFKMTGNLDKLDIYSSVEIDVDGEIKELNIYEGVYVHIKRGKVAVLNISRGAAGAVVELDKGVVVTLANINAAVDIKGRGRIATAVEGAPGITYQTEPDTVKKYNGGSKSKSTPVLTLTPVNGKIDVDITADLKVTFDRAMYRSNGATLTASYFENYVAELRKGSESGTKVEYNAVVNSNKKSVTMELPSSLDTNTKYYIIIKSGTLSDKDGNTNDGVTSSFTTIEKSVLVPKITPAAGTEGVDTDVTVTLKFDEKILRKNGNEVDSSYISGSVVEIHKGSVNGTKIGINAQVNIDKNTIVITPNTALTKGEKYYVVVLKNTLTNVNGDYNPRVVYSFTVQKKINFGIVNEEKNVPIDKKIVLKFEEPVYKNDGMPVTAEYLKDNCIKLMLNYSYASNIDFSVKVSNDGETITVTPKNSLSLNTKYYFEFDGSNLKYESGEKIGQWYAFFTTVSSVADITKLTAEANGISEGVVYIKSDASGTAYVTVTSKSGEKYEKSVSLSANSQKTLTFTGLKKSTEYSVSAYIVDSTGNYKSDTHTTSFATEEEAVNLKVSNIEFTAARVNASFNTAGSLTVYYKDKNNNMTYLLTNYKASSSGKKTVELTGLTSGDKYAVTAVFEADGGNKVVKTVEFTTDYTLTDSTLSSITVTVGNEQYRAAKNGDASYMVVVSTPNDTEDIYVTPNATAGKRSTITVGEETVVSGTKSSAISITAGTPAKIAIQVTAENGSKTDYELNVVAYKS